MRVREVTVDKKSGLVVGDPIAMLRHSVGKHTLYKLDHFANLLIFLLEISWHCCLN